ncbi:MAG: gp53-like domain-containing protein [Fusobacteriaceae bacterium]
MVLVKPLLIKPKIGGDPDIWGDKLNRNIDLQDDFNSKLVDKNGTQDQELARLEIDKISQSDINTVVKNTVDNYVEVNTKPDIDNYVETVSKPNINNHVVVKKNEIDVFTEEQKRELDAYKKAKEVEITSHTELEKGNITSHVVVKKNEIDAFTEEQKIELDLFEKLQEDELNTHTDGKKVELTEKGDYEIARVMATGIDSILDEIDFTTGYGGYTITRDETSDSTVGFFEREKTYKLGQLVDKIYVDKQDKESSELLTDSKLVVGAINENRESARTAYDKGEEALALTNSQNTAMDTKKADKSTQVIAGGGLTGGGTLASNSTFNVVSQDEGIIVNEDNIKLNIVDDLSTGGVRRALSAEQGKVLNTKINAMGSGGISTMMRNSEKMAEPVYTGTLPSGGKTIAVGVKLFNPILHLNGIRIEENKYSVELTSGTINMIDIYSPEADIVWVVEDTMDYHVSFCFPSLSLLVSDEGMKARIKLGDVIKILGASEADDGGHFLVKCESASKLNGVDIGSGRWLNEIPNTRMSGKLDKGSYIGTADGFVKKTGDTMTGNLVVPDILVNVRAGTGAKFGSKEYKAMVGVSSAIGEYLFGGSTNPTLDGLESYIRMSKTKLAYTTLEGGPTYNIFHEGNNPISKGANGWCKLANGMIMQWGETSQNISGDRIQTFPVSFATTNFQVMFTNKIDLKDYMYYVSQFNKKVSSVNYRLAYRRADNTYTAGGIPDILNWMAIGY